MNSKLLSSGLEMPLLGLGTWQAAPSEVEAAVATALGVGYRHIDTAAAYKTEREVGRAIRGWLASGGKRDELFVTSKLPHTGNRAADVKTHLMNSLNSLQLDYLDLYLMHMPFTLQPDETGAAPARHPDGSVVLEDTDHLAVWREMESLVKQGLIRSIGVSNFNGRQLQQLMSEADIPPSNLQVELHVALQQPELRGVCADLGVALTAYSPLGSPGFKDHLRNKYGKDDVYCPDILNDPTVVGIAEKLFRTPAQVLLRFLVQQKIAVIPKSVNPQRIKENSQIFDFKLSRKYMEELTKLDRGCKGRIVDFLFLKGVEKHAEYPFHEVLEFQRFI